MLLFAALISGVWSVRRRIANSLPRGAGGGDVVGERFVHTAFWVTALGAGLLVFMIGSPNPFTTDGRYLLGPYVAIAAILPLMLERGLGWKLIVTAGASLFAFSALYQFNSGVLKEMPAGYQTAGTARAVAAYAKQEHVAVGYGYYWNSIDLMWESDFKVDVYPIQRCEHERPVALHVQRDLDLQLGQAARQRPQHARGQSQGHGRCARPPAEFGPPIASTRAGGLILYVYPYDIATKLQPEKGLTL